MKMFEIKAGTKIKVHKHGESDFHYPVEDRVAKKDILFMLEDLVVDPIGSVGVGPQHKKLIGGFFAERGYCGFHYTDRRGTFTILVHQSDLEVM